MPLLLCPNDSASMTTVQRSGVEFDMCPTCRGVWLDRGELEKLMAAETQPEAVAAPTPWQRPVPQNYESSGPSRPRSDYDNDRKRYDDDDYRGGHRKKRSIFDIFD